MSIELTDLTIATFNPGKLKEYQQLLGGVALRLSELSAFAGVTEVDETGETFAENARLKAVAYALQTNTVTLADDSGLEIDALDGRPGVLSARYAGENTTFGDKMAYVLREIAASGDNDRRARFVCEIVVANADGSELAKARGVCEGRIAEQAVGNGGFGYDPIFVPNGFDETFGQLSASIKHEISHRARAFAQIMLFLRDNTAV